jgi:hypothetical protein
MTRLRCDDDDLPHSLLASSPVRRSTSAETAKKPNRRLGDRSDAPVGLINAQVLLIQKPHPSALEPSPSLDCRAMPLPPSNRTESASTSEITLSSSSSSSDQGLPFNLSTDDFSSSLSLVTDHISSRAANLPSLPTLPPPDDIASALDRLATDVPEEGMGTKKVVEHLLEDIVKGLAPGHAGPRVRERSSSVCTCGQEERDERRETRR